MTTLHRIIDDSNISLKAKGLFLYLSSRPAGWKVCIENIAKENSDGQTAIYSAIKELEGNGYLMRKRFYENGRIAGIDYKLCG